MKLKFPPYCFILFSCLCASLRSLGQANLENVIQINGVTMTADSLRAVPDVTISVKNKNRGVESEYTGVFTLVCYKGDTLEFSCLGFRPKEFVVSKNLQG